MRQEKKDLINNIETQIRDIYNNADMRAASKIDSLKLDQMTLQQLDALFMVLNRNECNWIKDRNKRI